MLRLFYIAACFLSLANGVWMLFLPESWYTDFPAAVPHTGPFNPHFVRDIGVAYLTVGLGFGWCARHLERSQPVHLGLTVFSVGHALIHLADLLMGRLPGAHWIIDTPLVFAPALLLVLLAVPSIRRRVA